MPKNQGLTTGGPLALQPDMKECPKCARTLPVASGFGYRMYRGVPYAQSHCRECRSAGSKAVSRKTIATAPKRR